MTSFPRSGSRWMVGDGSGVSLWFDIWLANHPLIRLAPLQSFPPTLKFSSIIANGSWDIPMDLPEEGYDILKGLDGTQASVHETDKLFWNVSNSPMLPLSCGWELIRSRSSKNAWAAITGNNLQNPSASCFCWKFFQKKLPLNNRAQSLGVSLASRCPFCSRNQETASHLFFSCTFAHKLWSWLFSSVEANDPQIFSFDSIWSTLVDSLDSAAKKGISAICVILLFVI